MRPKPMDVTVMPWGDPTVRWRHFYQPHRGQPPDEVNNRNGPLSGQLVNGERRRQCRVRVADYVTVAIDTGMRRGELLSLEPGHVEKGWVHLWKTKTNSPRSIPLSPRTEAILERLRALRPRPLFLGLPQYSLRWYWERARAGMGLQQGEGFVVHALRHTCATRLVNDGVDVFTVQKWMGHADLKTTQRYVHINDRNLLRARDRLVEQQQAQYTPKQYTHKN